MSSLPRHSWANTWWKISTRPMPPMGKSLKYYFATVSNWATGTTTLDSPETKLYTLSIRHDDGQIPTVGLAIKRNTN